MVRLGRGSFLGFGIIDDYTDVTPVLGDIEWWHRVAPGFDDLTQDVTHLEFPNLNTYDMAHELIKGGQIRGEGAVNIAATYDTMHEFLRLITGHNQAPTGAGPYTYPFSPVDPNDTNHYLLGSTKRQLIVEAYKGEATNSIFYYGMLPNEFGLTFEPDGYVQMALGLIGRGGVRGAFSTPTYASDEIVTPTGQSAAFFQIGATPYVCLSASLQINNGMDYRFDVSARRTLQPYPQNKREVTLTVEIETDTDAWMDNAVDPEGSPLNTVQLKIDNGAAAGANRQLVFIFPKCVVMSPAEARPSGIGPVTTQLQLKALSTGGGPAYTCQVINGQSAYIH